MRVVEILKSMAFGAGTAGLKVVGSLAFPGAWPIIEEALEPVIDLLKTRLGVDDPLDEKSAHAAWSQLLTDGTLIKVFDDQLQRAVASLRASHDQLEEGQRRLLQILDGNNADVLKVIQEDLDRMRTAGVTVAKPSVEAIRTAVGEEFAERIRGLEQRLDQFVVARKNPEAERDQLIRRRFRDQLARTQARAVELLNQREFDRAADELRSGLESLQLLIEGAPDNVDLRVNLAYYFKTIAATFAGIDKDGVPASIDQAKIAEEFNEQAMTIFYFVAYGLSLEKKTVRDQAHAVNGVGNIHYARGQHRLAIENYDLATRLDPHYCYAWHDLFAAYYALADQGNVNFPAMRHSLDRTWETGQGQPGLGAKRLEQLEQMIARFDPDAIAGVLIEEGLMALNVLRQVAEHPLADVSEPAEDAEIDRALRARRRGATQQAREMLSAVVEDFDRGRSQDARRAAVALCHLGSIEATTDAQVAYQHYARAVDLAPAWADAWWDLGVILTHLGRSSEAAPAFLRSAIQARVGGNRALLLATLEYTAMALSSEVATRAVAIRMLRGLLYAYHSTNDNKALLGVYWKLAELDVLTYNAAEAAHFANVALRLAEKLDDRAEQARFTLMLARLAEQCEDRAEAQTRYKRALLLLEETGPEELIQQAAAKVEELG